MRFVDNLTKIKAHNLTLRRRSGAPVGSKRYSLSQFEGVRRPALSRQRPDFALLTSVKAANGWIDYRLCRTAQASLL
jgi:hypothetical protein